MRAAVFANASFGAFGPAGMERLDRRQSGLFAVIAGLDLTLLALVGHAGWLSLTRASASRSGGRFRLHAVGTPISGHDVSGTGWQTLGRAMQSITTMMPVWQCGHSRNDCPVSASNRSR